MEDHGAGHQGPARAGLDILTHAPDVIAARLRLMAEGLADPARADTAELRRMTTEKLEAMAASGTATARGLERASDHLARAACHEADEMARATRAVLGAPDAASALASQARYLMGWWNRSAMTGLALASELESTGQAALHPFQAATRANAERLKR